MWWAGGWECQRAAEMMVDKGTIAGLHQKDNCVRLQGPASPRQQVLFWMSQVRKDKGTCRDGDSPGKGSEALGLEQFICQQVLQGPAWRQQCSLLGWGQHWDRWAKSTSQLPEKVRERQAVAYGLFSSKQRWFCG